MSSMSKKQQEEEIFSIIDTKTQWVIQKGMTYVIGKFSPSQKKLQSGIAPRCSQFRWNDFFDLLFFTVPLPNEFLGGDVPLGPWNP